MQQESAREHTAVKAVATHVTLAPDADADIALFNFISSSAVNNIVSPIVLLRSLLNGTLPFRSIKRNADSLRFLR